MGATRDRLQEDLKTYMKNGDKVRLNIVRMLFTEVKNAEINDTKERGRARTEEETIAILSAYHKSLAKTVTEFPEAKQAEMKAELQIIEEYLPKRMSAEEVRAEVQKDLAGNSERNFGALMKHFQGKFGSQVDGKTLSEAIKESLKTLG